MSPPRGPRDPRPAPHAAPARSPSASAAPARCPVRIVPLQVQPLPHGGRFRPTAATGGAPRPVISARPPRPSRAHPHPAAPTPRDPLTLGKPPTFPLTLTRCPPHAPLQSFSSYLLAPHPPPPKTGLRATDTRFTGNRPRRRALGQHRRVLRAAALATYRATRATNTAYGPHRRPGLGGPVEGHGLGSLRRLRNKRPRAATPSCAQTNARPRHRTRGDRVSVRTALARRLTAPAARRRHTQPAITLLPYIRFDHKTLP